MTTDAMGSNRALRVALLAAITYVALAGARPVTVLGRDDRVWWNSCSTGVPDVAVCIGEASEGVGLQEE